MKIVVANVLPEIIERPVVKGAEPAAEQCSAGAEQIVGRARPDLEIVARSEELLVAGAGG